MGKGNISRSRDNKGEIGQRRERGKGSGKEKVISCLRYSSDHPLGDRES